MRIVENTEDLKALCKELNKQKFITVDTEFVREKTYFSEVCLIQVGWIDDAAIIDPLAQDMDLEPFSEVLSNKKVLKICLLKFLTPFLIRKLPQWRAVSALRWGMILWFI